MHNIINLLKIRNKELRSKKDFSIDDKLDLYLFLYDYILKIY